MEVLEHKSSTKRKSWTERGQFEQTQSHQRSTLHLKRRASQPPGPSREAPDGPGSESLAAEHLRRRVRSELSQPLTGAESHARRDEVTPQPCSGTDTTRNGRVEVTGDSGFHFYPRKVGADLSTDPRKVLPVNNQ